MSKEQQQQTIKNPSHALAYAVLFEQQQALDPSLTPEGFEKLLQGGLAKKRKLAKAIHDHAGE